jgi:hypothetical protein
MPKASVASMRVRGSGALKGARSQLHRHQRGTWSGSCLSMAASKRSRDELVSPIGDGMLGWSMAAEGLRQRIDRPAGVGVIQRAAGHDPTREIADPDRTRQAQ